MKLVIATPLYPPEIGGPATHTLFLERALPAQDIRVRTVPFSSVSSLPKGIRHIVYAFHLWTAARRSDAIFAQDTVSVGFPALVAAWCARVPLLVRVPGDHAWEQGRERFGVTDSLDEFQTKRYGWRVELLRRTARFVVRHADRVIVPSRYFEHIVGGWLLKKDRLRVIYNGVDFDNIPLKPLKMPAHPFMVSAGRLVPWKGFGALIELVARMPEWSLVIVGDGPLREELIQKSGVCGVSDRILFTGNVSREEVLGWLSVADAFVLNSSFESFSYQVVEALGTGVPVIATSIGSIPELITDGVEGILVKPDDIAGIETALRSILTNPVAWRKRTDAAKLTAVRFSAEATAQMIAQEIRTLVGSSGGRHISL